MKSNRTDRANATLSNLQGRKESMQQMLESINKLAEMFKEVQNMVAVQDTQIQTIEAQGTGAVADVTRGAEQLVQAESKARSKRRWKRICLAIASKSLNMRVPSAAWHICCVQ